MKAGDVSTASETVTRGLDPRVHLSSQEAFIAKRMDCRVKPGNDGLRDLSGKAETVARGLDPRVHPSSQDSLAKRMDCRVKPGNDG